MSRVFDISARVTGHVVGIDQFARLGNVAGQADVKVRGLQAHLNSFKESARDSAKVAAQSWKGVGHVLGSVGKTVFSLPTLLTGVAGGMFSKMVLDAADYKDNTLTAFEVVLKSRDLAKEIYTKANNFAAVTPFETKEVISATNQLLAFGFAAKSELFPVLEDAGNLAAGMNVDFQSVVDTFGKIKAGSFGDAFSRLRDFGVTRQMLEGQGLKFDKGGSYKGSVDDAMKGVQKLIRSRFAGLMNKKSSTLSGLFSTLESKPLELFQDVDIAPVKRVMTKVANLMDFTKPPGSLFKKNAIKLMDTAVEVGLQPVERGLKMLDNMMKPKLVPTSSVIFDEGSKGYKTLYKNMSDLDLAVDRTQNRLHKFEGWWTQNLPLMLVTAKTVTKDFAGTFKAISDGMDGVYKAGQNLGLIQSKTNAKIDPKTGRKIYGPPNDQGKAEMIGHAVYGVGAYAAYRAANQLLGRLPGKLITGAGGLLLKGALKGGGALATKGAPIAARGIGAGARALAPQLVRLAPLALRTVPYAAAAGAGWGVGRFIGTRQVGNGTIDDRLTNFFAGNGLKTSIDLQAESNRQLQAEIKAIQASRSSQKQLGPPKPVTQKVTAKVDIKAPVASSMAIQVSSYYSPTDIRNMIRQEQAEFERRVRVKLEAEGASISKGLSTMSQSKASPSTPLVIPLTPIKKP
jgi:hypothetical protein